ncbi:hypothetical protein BDV36DRAFT_257613, partial [Aspergillus pseudocaelatus]
GLVESSVMVPYLSQSFIFIFISFSFSLIFPDCLHLQPQPFALLGSLNICHPCSPVFSSPPLLCIPFWLHQRPPYTSPAQA